MRIVAIGFATVLGFGCAAEETTLEDYGPVACHGEHCRLSGSQIGKEGVTVRLDRGTATFVDWIPKAGDPGKYVGFTMILQGATQEVWYGVSTGGETHYSSKTSWKHLGSECEGIDDVDLGAGADQDGGGGGCTDPDGCPDGGGGGGDGGDGPLL